MNAECRLSVLRKNVPADVQTRRNAHPQGVTCLAVHFFVCLRSKIWAGECCGTFRLFSLLQITAQLQRDVGKYSTEYIVSSDELLVGFRGLWNFGEDPRKAESAPVTPSVDFHDPEDLLSPPINGRLSAGLELYYGLLSKGGGCIDREFRS